MPFSIQGSDHVVSPGMRSSHTCHATWTNITRTVQPEEARRRREGPAVGSETNSRAHGVDTSD